jgi:hypothetical protein
VDESGRQNEEDAEWSQGLILYREIGAVLPLSRAAVIEQDKNPFTFTTEHRAHREITFCLSRGVLGTNKRLFALSGNINLAEGLRPSGESVSPDSPERYPLP